MCHQVTAKFSQSWKKFSDLTLSQAENDLPAHKLMTDCITRWGSTYDMVNQIAEQQKAICVVLASDREVIS